MDEFVDTVERIREAQRNYDTLCAAHTRACRDKAHKADQAEIACKRDAWLAEVKRLGKILDALPPSHPASALDSVRGIGMPKPDDGKQVKILESPPDPMRLKAERVRGYAAAQGISLVECVEILTPSPDTHPEHYRFMPDTLCTFVTKSEAKRIEAENKELRKAIESDRREMRK